VEPQRGLLPDRLESAAHYLQVDWIWAPVAQGRAVAGEPAVVVIVRPPS
jgi:hypothetical protein